MPRCKRRNRFPPNRTSGAHGNWSDEITRASDTRTLLAAEVTSGTPIRCEESYIEITRSGDIRDSLAAEVSGVGDGTSSGVLDKTFSPRPRSSQRLVTTGSDLGLTAGTSSTLQYTKTALLERTASAASTSVLYIYV